MDDLAPPSASPLTEPLDLIRVALPGQPPAAAASGPEQNQCADPPAPASGDDAALAGLKEAMATGFAVVLRQLRDAQAEACFKEDQVTRLHEELQAHRSDLAGRPVRQLLHGLIRLHDDLGKVVAALRRQPPEELTPERFFQQLAGFEDDLELLLGQHGVARFEASGDSFDPRRQTTPRTVPTDDPAQVGQVAERLRPGFEQGETLLQKERVAVYVASHPNDKAHGGQP